MRSRDSAPGGTRRALETALHAVGCVALAVLIWHSIRLRDDTAPVNARGAGVRAALARWSTSQSPASAHVVLDSAPPPEVRDWVAALRSAGTHITWEGSALLPSAIASEPVVDPKHPTRVWVAAPAGTKVVVSDGLGVIDSTVARSAGAMFVLPQTEGTIRATVGATPATTAEHDSLIVRSILLISMASWEGKFVMASLEEHGWKVNARFALSPSGDVTQRLANGTTGTPLQIDTSKYAAVIVLDSVGSRYANQIMAYVRQGGGFIAAGDAAGLSMFVPVLPAIADRPTPIQVFEADSAAPRKALAMTPLTDLKPGALVLERQGNNVAVAGWRAGRGRVFQVGYLDTWRWRMAGADIDPVANHRAWWNGLVSAVAYAPRLPREMSATVEPTPLATLVSVLGAPEPQRIVAGSPLTDSRLGVALFALVLTAFFAGWTSRRLGGRA